MTPPMLDFAWRQAALPLAARRSPICAANRLTSSRSASRSSRMSFAPAAAASLASLTASLASLAASLAAFDMLVVFDMNYTHISTPRRGADRRRALADHAAGDAITGIAGRIAFVVVLAAMDHNGGAGSVKDRIGLALVQRDRRFHHLYRKRTAF